MKKNILLVFLLVAFGFVGLQAQVSFDETELTTIEPNDGNPDVVGHNKVVNNSSEEQSYDWTRTEVYMPEEWQSAVCDINSCYVPQVGAKDFTLAAGAEGTMDVHVRPNGVAGCAKIEIELVNQNDSNDKILATYFFEVGTVECTVSTTDQLDARSIKVYPNPTRDFFRVEDSANAISEVVIYNVIGRQMLSFSNNDSGQYDVSGLMSGLYLVQLKEADGSIVKTIRLQRS